MKDKAVEDPITELLNAVYSLTKPITDPVWQDKPDARGISRGRTLAIVNRPALLVQLRSAISSSIGSPSNTIAGGGAQLGGLNIGAFTMYEDIEGRIRAAWFEVSGERSKDAPEVLLPRWYVHVKNLHLAGLWSESLVRTWRSVIRGWAKGIDSMFNPEVVKELVGPCPNPGCQLSRIVDRDGVGQSALYLHYGDDNEPEAVCRSCGWAVTGPRSLLELGYHLGATVDEEALREMGVIV